MNEDNVDFKLRLAFQSKGISFFEFTDEFAMPTDRALAAMDIYEELNQRIDKVYLKDYFHTVEHLLNKGKLVDVGNLTKMAASRLDHITHGQLVMKMAAVTYVAEWENPNRFSLEDMDKKIAFWMQNEDVESFFLQKPIKKFIPYLEQSDWNIKNYLQAQAEELKRQLAFHLNLVSDENELNDLKSSLISQLEQIKVYQKWLQ